MDGPSDECSRCKRGRSKCACRSIQGSFGSYVYHRGDEIGRGEGTYRWHPLIGTSIMYHPMKRPSLLESDRRFFSLVVTPLFNR